LKKILEYRGNLWYYEKDIKRGIIARFILYKKFKEEKL